MSNSKPTKLFASRPDLQVSDPSASKVYWLNSLRMPKRVMCDLLFLWGSYFECT